MGTQTLTKKIGQFGGEADANGNVSSDISKNFNLFGLKTGLKDLVGADTLQYIADKLPFIEYDPNYGGGNYLKFDSPNLSVPTYGTYDLKGYMGFDLDLGVNLHFAYDFGAINADVTVNAPRTDGVLVRNAYTLDTGATSISANVAALPGTKPFNLGLYLGSSEPAEDGAPTPGYIHAGLYDVGVYKNGNPTSYVYDIALDDSNVYSELIGTGDLYPGQNTTFGSKSLYGEIGVPQLPSLNVTLGGTGANAVFGAGQATGTGPDFAAVHVHPIDYIPVVGEANQNTFNFITSPFIDAGLDYKVLDLDLSISAALRQTLNVSIKSVTVHATAEESDVDEPSGSGRVDNDEHPGDGFYTVDTKDGKLGDIFTFGNFSTGERGSTRIVETYTVTLHFDQDISIVLSGGVDLTFLSASLFINPILIDELRFNLGPLFQTSLSLELASIDIDSLVPGASGGFDINFTLAPVVHTIHTLIDVVGTSGNDKNLKLIETSDPATSQLAVDGLAGDDTIKGNRYANTLDGGDGADLITGGNLNSTADDADLIRGGAGWDSLYGGVGNDIIYTGAGGTGLGQYDFESVYGQSGDDTLYAEGGSATLDGGDGNDTLYGVISPFGNQKFIGGGTDANVDRLIYDASGYGFDLSINFQSGSGTLIPAGGFARAVTYQSIERIEFHSGEGNDYLNGTNQPDIIGGGGGDDKVYGAFGDDTVSGDDGKDTVRGSDGNDTLYGGADDDFLNGDGGNDIVHGDAGADIIGYYINSGGKLTYGMDESGNDTINGGDGDDLIRDVHDQNMLNGGAGDDKITGGGNYTTISGDAGDDELTTDTGVTIAFGGDGDDLIYAAYGGVPASGASAAIRMSALGGAGSDRFQVRGTSDAVDIYGDLNGITYPPGDVDTLIVLDFASSEPLGMAFPYVPPIPATGPFSPLTTDGRLSNGTTWHGIEAFFIRGDAGAQKLVAGNYDDTLDGGAGNDYLDGRGGIDTLIGGKGDDILVGAIGDKFDGGDGIDTLAIDAGTIETIDVTSAILLGIDLGLRIDLGTVSQRLEPFTPGANTGPYTLITERIGSGSFGTQIKDIETLYMTAASRYDDRILGADRADRIMGGDGDDTLSGLAGDDTIYGGLGEDTILGGDGADKIYDDDAANDPNAGVAEGSGDRLFGGAGNDTIYASANAGYVSGDGGDDYIVVSTSPGTHVIRAGALVLNTIDGGEGSDTIFGSDADERIIGGIESVDAPPPTPTDPTGQTGTPQPPAYYDKGDTIFARGGDDVVDGGNGNDIVDGGEGDDTIKGGSGDDKLSGGNGHDVIDGGSGADRLSGGVNDDEIGDELYGGLGNDTIDGSNGADVIDGGLGNDIITSGGLNSLGDSFDLINGGFGNDTITATNDAVIDGGLGDDAITLGEGVQEVIARRGTLLAPGTDTVIGFTPGEDVLHFDGPGLRYDQLVMTNLRGGGVRVTFSGVSNAPVVILRGLTSADLGPGSIVVTGPPVPTNDVIVMSNGKFASVPNALLLANDSGHALTITGVSNQNGASASLFDGRILVGAGNANGAFDYTASNDEGTATGSVSVSVITTTDTADNIELDAYASLVGAWIDLRGGDDELGGSIAGDYISGGLGNDRIAGLGGDDYVSGGKGNDTLSGGAGNDSLTGNEGNDDLTDLEGVNTMVGGDGNDTYTIASTAATTIIEQANGGVDTVISRADLVLGDNLENGRLGGRAVALTGNALANDLRGNSSGNTVHGGDNNDAIGGGGGIDDLYGDAGNDVISGDGGADRLFGGAGADRFVFLALTDGGDSIRDFVRADGDRIDLSAIDAVSGVDGDQAFTFIGNAAFANAGDLRVTAVPRTANTWLVQVDVDGDHVADMTFSMTSTTTPNAGDFTL